MKVASLLLVITLGCSGIKAQIRGIVLDKESRNPLPFASLSLKNKAVGSATNEAGVFLLQKESYSLSDTLIISHIGYESAEMPISMIRDSLVVELSQNSVQLDAVLIYPLSPTTYINRAIEKIKENYPVEPFQTIAQYDEKLMENNLFVEGKQGLFKSYYPSYQDTVKNQHQLLAFRKAENLKELEFMKKQREKSFEKEKKRAEKEKDTNEIVMDGTNLENMFGGPEMILSIDLMKQREPFLDSNEFDSFKYSFGKNTVYQGRDLIVIHFKARKKFEHMKLEGDILIDATTYAIVAIDYDGIFVLPLYLKPILFVVGLRVQRPVFEKKILYEPYQDKWYPKKLHWNISARLTKTHWFSPNEISDFELGQVFVIKEMKKEGIFPIQEEKRYVPRKKMEEQVYPEGEIMW